MKNQNLKAETGLEQEKPKSVGIIVEALQDLARTHGFEAAKAIAVTIAETASKGDHPTIEDLETTISAFPERKTFQKEIFQYLEERGLIEKRLDNVLVINDRLLSSNSIKDALGRKINGRMGTTRAEQMGNLFVGEQTVLKIRDNETTPIEDNKPEALFYAPESKKDAFDLNKIRSAEFHFGVWEIFQGIIDKKGQLVGQPGAIDDLTLMEATIACIIFHPKFGDGQRDEKGRLIVKDPNGETTFFSSGWLRKWPGMSSRASETGKPPLFELFFTNSQTMADNLLKSGLLQRRDFARTKEMKTSETRINDNGQVAIGSVKHYLGRQYAGARVEPLGEMLAVVGTDASGNEIIVATGRKFKKDSVGVIQRKFGSGIGFEAPADLCQPIPFERQNPLVADNPDGIDEKIEKLRQLDNLQTKLNFDNQLKQAGAEARINFLPSFLQKRIQQNTSNLAEAFSSGLELAQRDGQDGLEILASVVDNKNLTVDVLRLLEKITTPELNEVKEVVKNLCRLRLAAESIFTGLAPEKDDAIDGAIAEIIRTTNTALGRGVKGKAALSEQLTAAGTNLFSATGELQASLVADLATQIGADNLRVKLQGLARTGDSYIKPVFESMLRIMSPETPEDVKIDLRALYEKIKFEQYKLNEASQKKDEEFLKGNLRPSNSVVDLGAGTGRLTKPMAEAGMKVTAIDYVPRHVSLIRKNNPGVEVRKADWTETGLPDEGQDAIFSLGRSILHEFTLARQEALFQEANRVLKAGGKFIIDIPDRTKGNYAHLVESYKAAMAERKIPIREGLIYDSPDGQNFFTRYVYSLDDIRQLAEQNGFQIEKTQTTPIETGKDDENIYIVMKKICRPKEQLPLAT